MKAPPCRPDRKPGFLFRAVSAFPAVLATSVSGLIAHAGEAGQDSVTWEAEPDRITLRGRLDEPGATVRIQYRKADEAPLAGRFVPEGHTIDDTIEEGDGQSLADITGDGRKNIIVGTGSGGRVHWYERTSPGRWERHLIADGFTEVEGTVAADFNGDGRIEVVILDQATRNPPGKVVIAKQDTADPRGSWSTLTLDSAAYHAQQGRVYDITGDGNPDFVYSVEGRAADDGGFFWMQNLGGNPLDPDNWVRHEIDRIAGAWWIDANGPKDFSGNGIAGDILVSVRENRNRGHARGAVIIYHRPDDPLNEPWGKTVIEDRSAYVPLHVVSGDFTGNGDDRDIASGGSHDGGEGLYWYEFRTWRRHVIEEKGRWWGTHAFDINKSGRFEIISGAQADNTLRIYSYNDESGRYEQAAADRLRKPDDQIIFDDITGDEHVTEFYVGSDPLGLFWYQAFELEWEQIAGVEILPGGTFEALIPNLEPGVGYQVRTVIESAEGRMESLVRTITTADP